MAKDYSNLSFIELKNLLKTQLEAVKIYKASASKPGADPKFAKLADERNTAANDIQIEIDKRIKQDEESRA